MGTRNLTIVMQDGAYKIAQYGQWDGYPEGQGAEVLSFCHKMKDEGSWPAFSKQLAKCRFIDQPTLTKLYAECGADGSGRINMEVSARFAKRHPQLDRDMGAEILDFVMQATDDVYQTNQIDFAGNSCVCEWAYVIDLDKGTLEAYKGFNETALEPFDRFYGFPIQGHVFKNDAGEDFKYQPIKLAGIWPLDTLPSNKEFCEYLNPEEE